MDREVKSARSKKPLWGRIVESVFGLSFLCFSILILFFLAFLLGYRYFQQPLGNDTIHAFSGAVWFERWWPEIPHWYYPQGAGVVNLWGYPVLPSLMVVVLSKLSRFSLLGSFQLLGFLSLPLSALGMYLFVWRRLKNQAMALVSSVFYLLMPIAWVWLFDWGFYSEHISYFFFFPAWFFFDFFLEGLRQKRSDWAWRGSLVATIFLLGLVFASHPLHFFSLIRLWLIYAPISFFGAKEKKRFRGERWVRLGKGLLVPVALAILANLFLMGNYQYYSAQNKGSTNVLAGLTREQLIESYQIPYQTFFGLVRPGVDDPRFTQRNMVLPAFVWLPAIVGTVGALFLSRKVSGIAIAGWLSAFLTHRPDFLYPIINLKLPFFPYLTGLRVEMAIFKFCLPIVAGFGFLLGPLLIWRGLEWLVKKKGLVFSWLGSLFQAGALLFLAGLVFLKLVSWPTTLWPKEVWRAGPYYFNWREPWNRLAFEPELPRLGSAEFLLSSACWDKAVEMGNFCSYYSSASPQEGERLTRVLEDDCLKGEEEDRLCTLVLPIDQAGPRLISSFTDRSTWPSVELNSELDPSNQELAAFNRSLGNDSLLRLDVSPRMGGVTQSLNISNQASMINLYTAQLNLLGPYWGYQQNIFYGGSEVRGETLSQMADWFGTRFVILNPKLDPTERYVRNPAWRNWGETSSILEYQDSPRLWTVTTGKPTVLVIGDREKGAYESVFKLASQGGAPYQDFWLVEGRKSLDQYSLVELQEFEMVMLLGARYKATEKVEAILEDYIRSGGGLYLSSGWQYVDQYWQAEETPSFWPVEVVNWQSKWGSGRLAGSDSDWPSFDYSAFGELRWGEVDWGAGVGSGVRDWAEPVLTVEDQPLVVVGSLGQGRVVWSGLSFTAHLQTYDYPSEEILFYRSLLDWLGRPSVIDLTEQTTAVRSEPDQLKIDFLTGIKEPTVVYLRESYFPNWQARLVGSDGKVKEVEIYPGGPQMRWLKLPSVNSGDLLVFDFKPGWWQWLFWLASGLVWLGLVAYLFGWQPFSKKLLDRIIGGLLGWKKGLINRWDEEG